MAKKPAKPKGKSPVQAGPRISMFAAIKAGYDIADEFAAWSAKHGGSEGGFIPVFANHMHEPHGRAMLFNHLADQVEALFPATDAVVVAPWFRRLAAGEDARQIFCQINAGRPKGRTSKPRRCLPDGSMATDIDIAVIVHALRRRGSKPGRAHRIVADIFGMNSGNVRTIYQRLKKRYDLNLFSDSPLFEQALSP